MSSDRTDPTSDRYRNAYFRLRGILHDAATGLPAVPVVADVLRPWLDARRTIGVLHVEAVGVDLVESLYGWQVFDRVLALMARVLQDGLKDLVPPGSILAVDAVPAERFAVFVPSASDGRDVDGALLARLAASLRARLDDAFDADDLGSLAPRLNFRCGHAVLSDSPFHRFERRLRAAVDEARRQDAVREGRRGRAWRAELVRIIRDGAISTLFQPVVVLETRAIVGFEALSRGPKNSALEMPRALFALSDRVGSAVDLDRLCRTSALVASEAAAGRGRIFLNVHRDGLVDREWRAGVASLLAASSRQPRDLVLEISERALGDDLDAVARACAELREDGFGIALDDVGTGYGSLLGLDRIRPDFLKADVGLVHGADADLVRREALGTIVRAGERIGAAVIAVGVETEAEAEALRRAGVVYGQGFLFAGPAPLGALLPAPASDA